MSPEATVFHGKAAVVEENVEKMGQQRSTGTICCIMDWFVLLFAHKKLLEINYLTLLPVNV